MEFNFNEDVYKRQFHFCIVSAPEPAHRSRTTVSSSDSVNLAQNRAKDTGV